MRKRRTSQKAVQLAPQESGVQKWQRDFWLALIEHVQGGKRGAPDLSRLEGFLKPAVTRYAVTTLELLHGFDKYNVGKPYHRQVRPFGFMVMFQEEELAQAADRTPAGKRSRKRASTMLRVIAPFNRDPAIAARHAFDRDTGKPVSPKQLKTYIRALRHYHDHPEAKFLNGERADRGPTERRYIIARSIRHIGKEANKLDSQLATGTDPGAQAEFGAGTDGRKERVAAIKRTVERFGPVAVARTADISRQYLFAITQNGVIPTDGMLSRIEQAIVTMEGSLHIDNTAAQKVLANTKTMIEQIGLRHAADVLKVDPGYLSRVLSHKRPLTQQFAYQLSAHHLKLKCR